MDESQLTPNPDKCPKFDPNPFKKEKCKNCARLWNEHLGVISEELARGFIQAMEDKRQKEVAAKAKAAAKEKAVARGKKPNKAVEDDWLFGGSNDACAADVADDSDDDMGFRMFSRDDLAAVKPPPQQREAAPLKVVNLIDFGECDIAEEDPSPHSAVGAPESVSTATPQGEADMETPPRLRTAAEQSATQESLLEEIQHLRQMLSDADEERNIQVAIIRDEVVEKEQAIEALKRQRIEAEEALSQVSAELQAKKAAEKELAEKARREAAESCAEIEMLRGEAERLKNSLEAATASLPKCGEAAEVEAALRSERAAAKVMQVSLDLAEQEAEHGRAEVETLRAQLQTARAAQEVAEAQVRDWAATLDSEREATKVAQEQAQKSRQEAAESKAEAEVLRGEAQCLQASLDEASLSFQTGWSLSRADTLASSVDTAKCVGGDGVEGESAQGEMTLAVSTLMTELRDMCYRTCEALGDTAEPLPKLEQGRDASSLEMELRSLRVAVAAAQAAATRAGASGGQLTLAETREGELPSEASRLLSSHVSGGAPLRQDSLRGLAPPKYPLRASLGMAQSKPLRGWHGTKEESASSEAGAMSMSAAARELKDIRIKAEQELAWISQRLYIGPRDDHRFPKVGSPPRELFVC
mmetsp:Transcript_1382/g.3044  ORF Transcript_1382/g.3044 Transcript_1382/m.3044 type:complete len:643 (-) Transcript_1382:265-2193(-)